MNVISPKLDVALNGVGYAKQREELNAIRKPDCAAAIWRRDLPEDFGAWVNGLAPEMLPKTRLVLHHDQVLNAVARLCDSSGLEDSAHRSWFITDVASNAAFFAKLMNAPYLRLRLDVITTNACRRFHIDAIHARLICTYRGTATQIGNSHEGAEPTHPMTLATGDAMIMRGTLWPATPNPELLHRSPPIEGSGETRLVLVLDPVFDPMDEE